jgi:hypothetical protein
MIIGKAIDFLSCFSISASEFPFTYRDEPIDEISDVWRKGEKRLLGFTDALLLCTANPYSAPCTTSASELKFTRKDITLQTRGKREERGICALTFAVKRETWPTTRARYT